MSRCPSCGGIIGRDCFNPVECAEITASIGSCNEETEMLANMFRREFPDWQERLQREYESRSVVDPNKDPNELPF